MRGVSLGSIRARVERLVSARLPAPVPVPLIIHWKLPDEPCPACGADLTAHAEAQAVAEASADRAHGDARVIYWADELTTCPTCGATLPS
jgi:hypothetical protein